jgi:hypothetical protein
MVDVQLRIDTIFSVGTTYFFRRMRSTASEPASSVIELIARLGSISGVEPPRKTKPCATVHVPNKIPNTTEYLKRNFVTINSFLGRKKSATIEDTHI